MQPRECDIAISRPTCLLFFVESLRDNASTRVRGQGPSATFSLADAEVLAAAAALARPLHGQRLLLDLLRILHVQGVLMLQKLQLPDKDSL